MPETVMGFVPRIAVSPPHGFGTRSHAMLISDARTILLPWREGRAILGPLLDAGVIEAKGVGTSESALNPEKWAQQSGAVVISHDAMARLQCRRTMNTYFLSIEFKSNKGPRKFSGFVIPSRAYLRRRKKEGIPSSKSALDYAVALGTVLRQIAPLANVVDWRV